MQYGVFQLAQVRHGPNTYGEQRLVLVDATDTRQQALGAVQDGFEGYRYAIIPLLTRDDAKQELEDEEKTHE